MKTLARNIIRGETDRYAVSTAAGQEWSPENIIKPNSGFKLSGGTSSSFDSSVSRINFHMVLRMPTTPPTTTQIFKNIRSDNSIIFGLYTIGTSLYIDLYTSSSSFVYTLSSFGNIVNSSNEWTYFFFTAKNNALPTYTNTNGVESTISNTTWNGQTVDFTQTTSFELFGGAVGTTVFDIKRTFISTNASLDFSNKTHRDWFIDENTGRLRIPDTSKSEITDALVYMGDTQKAGTSIDGRNFNSGYNMGSLDISTITGTVADVSS